MKSASTLITICLVFTAATLLAQTTVSQRLMTVNVPFAFAGFELSVHSPRFLKVGQVYLTYAHQRAEGSGAITGGLTDFSPGDEFFFLDHDQRHTLNFGGDVTMPR